MLIFECSLYGKIKCTSMYQKCEFLYTEKCQLTITVHQRSTCCVARNETLQTVSQQRTVLRLTRLSRNMVQKTLCSN